MPILHVRIISGDAIILLMGTKQKAEKNSWCQSRLKLFVNVLIKQARIFSFIVHKSRSK